MGFWKKLFRKKRRNIEAEDEWEKIVYIREDVDFNDEEQRTRYINGCLEQIAEASREIRLLTGEYNQVTSSLMDLDEVEELPEEEREELNRKAAKLLTLEKECASYRERPNRMSDGDYQQIKAQAADVEEGIRKIKEAESYAELVKQDLQRLNSERHAYAYRREELYTILSNLRGLTVVFITALVLCVVMLMVLQFGFEMDTQVGYFLSVAAGAIALTVICVKYLDADQECKKVENGINKLIQLQNKVKIRYVNNTNLLDYLCIKYHTQSGAALEKKWNQFKQEREERKQYAEAEAKIEYYQKEMVSQLSNFHISDPYRFVSRPECLLDKKEMVENRHDLIQRRQALRKQLDYNQDVSMTARKEIMIIADTYPDYAEEIRNMVDIYSNSEV